MVLMIRGTAVSTERVASLQECKTIGQGFRKRSVKNYGSYNGSYQCYKVSKLKDK